MDEAWERAVEAALHAGGGEGGSASPARSLTLDGAVKCTHGRLPAPQVLERHQGLEHLSIAGVGAASLQGFPRLRNLTRLTLSDNRIAGGLEHLVEAGLASLRDLDLSNNRIQDVDDLAPLARLRLVSLDLYECPVTRVKDYRSRVFGLIRTLRYLDKMDADENERPESDDDDDDDADGDGDGDGDGEEDEDDEDEDPGSGEVANGGVSHSSRGAVAAHPVEINGVIDVDEDESDADEVVPNRGAQHHHRTNGFRVAPVGGAVPEEDDEDVEDDDGDDEEYDEEEDLGEEIDEEGDEDDAVVEVHDVPSSEDEDDDIDEEDDDDVEEEVEDDGEEADEPESSGRVAVAVGGVGEEIDGHEQGEGDDDDDENGEIGEEDEERLEDNRVYEEGNDDDDADDEDEDTEYLVQPIVPPQAMAVGSPEEDFDVADPDDVDEDRDEVDDDDDEGATDRPSSSQGTKRKRGDDPSGSGSDDEDDDVEDPRPFKHH